MKTFKGKIDISNWQKIKYSFKDNLKGLTFTEKVLAVIFGILFGKIFLLIFLILFLINLIKSIFQKIYLTLVKIKNKLF